MPIIAKEPNRMKSRLVAANGTKASSRASNPGSTVFGCPAGPLFYHNAVYRAI